MHKLLIANRGEIAVRIVRTARELGFRTVAVFSEDDADALHARLSDEALALKGAGIAAYLDGEQIVRLAREAGCTLLHPGYGFLSERASLARECLAGGIAFVGPPPETLALLGNKTEARSLAERAGVPVPAGTGGPTSLEQARSFFESLGTGAAVVVKAIAGGGGRGVRIALRREELDAAVERCGSEAAAAFGSPDVYLEQYLPGARHIEVQVVADSQGALVHLFERDCSVQRRHQKLIEVAPAPGLSAALCARLYEAALKIARAADYRNAGTFEFLVTTEAEEKFFFIEANPRLQVEHTVTEELCGVDLVSLQLEIASGATFAELGLVQPSLRPSGYALEMRVNTERMQPDGSTLPTSGVLRRFDLPGGPGVRVDTAAYTGYANNPRFDSLLAKIIVRSASREFAAAAAKAERALAELCVEGVELNTALLRAILAHAEFRAGRATTRFVEDRLSELIGGTATANASRSPSPGGMVLPEGHVAVTAPMPAVVVSVCVSPGDAVQAKAAVLVLEAMKMEHVLAARTAGIVRSVYAAPGMTVNTGEQLVVIEPSDVNAVHAETSGAIDPALLRADVEALAARRALLLDEARPAAVERMRKRGHLTARELVGALCDPESFEEYGSFIIAAQNMRRDVDDLIKNTPADGLVSGIGRVNGELFSDDRARCAVMSYDYTVLAGTQGHRNHAKKDRLFELIERLRLPLIFNVTGGGGRPGDIDYPIVAALDIMTFAAFAGLSGLVPLVGIANGPCFAGNAAFAGCVDVLIATPDASIGMGGPAMIEGGGLGVYKPEEVGPTSFQAPNGVIDILVPDDETAVRVAKQYLAFFQGNLPTWEASDQRLLRHLIPENRVRSYDMRGVIETLADTGSVLELRQQFGAGMITALARIEGRPIGIMANNPLHLGGAIDAPAADKAARFMQLCDAFDLPILSLCDTPGFMVGPEVERTAQVRHVCRMFLHSASLTVPFVTLVLRKGYGLGAQSMARGSFRMPLLTAAWPTAEFGAMGLEGAVRLGFRRELEAISDPEQREKTFRSMVAIGYERGKALNMAAHFEIDEVIDPRDSRKRIINTLRAAPPLTPRSGKKRPCVDSW